MRFLLLLVPITLFLLGCEATAVKNTAQIKTKVKLAKNITLPIQARVAYHVDKFTPENKVNFYGKLEEAAELVTKDMFQSAEELTSTSDFDYLIKLKASSDWDRMWGGWDSDLQFTVVDRQGEVVFSKTTKSKGSGTTGLYDMNAVFNAFAISLKELHNDFLNRKYQQIAANTEAARKTPLSIKKLFDGIEPQNSGTGFFINEQGSSLTAMHVVDECIFIEMQHKGQVYDAKLVAGSNLLDLAVLKADYKNQKFAAINENSQASLGKQVFVTGYPLSGILADYPSLTVGNVSSRGGLKGSKGYFQFSAPIQPGNSGGAITDYKGNLVGVVSSSLNQAMMLKQSGTTAQNVNFGVDNQLLLSFLDKNDVNYLKSTGNSNFEQASADAVEYSNQILCYK